MSMNARALKVLYKRKKVNINGVKKALEDGIITQQEYEWVVM